MSGWPADPKYLMNTMRQYLSLRGNLSTEDGLILKGTAILTPKSMRNLILDKIHIGHPCQEKYQLTARANVFWFKMGKDILSTWNNDIMYARNTLTVNKDSHYFDQNYLTDHLRNLQQTFLT